MLVIFSGMISQAASPSILTSAQDLWLNKQNRTISVRPEISNAPFVFVGSGTTKRIKGLSAEYLEAIANKLRVKISYTEPAPLVDILRDTKEGKTDIVLSLSPTDELGQYFYFTDSYLTMPAVIVTRKDFKSNKKTISLSEFKEKKVAVGNNYPAALYVKTNYPKVIIESVPDDEVGLQKLLLGEVDAAVMDLASLSYYTSNDVLSYVKAVGRTGFEYKHSFAVPKAYPELLLILDTGLRELGDAEKQVIIDKWISVDTVDTQIAEAPQVRELSTLTLWLIFAGFVVLIIATVVTVITLRKSQFRAFFNRGAKKETMSEVKDELKELQMVHESLKEEMEHVSALEEDIQKKIHNVEKGGLYLVYSIGKI